MLNILTSWAHDVAAKDASAKGLKSPLCQLLCTCKCTACAGVLSHHVSIPKLPSKISQSQLGWSKHPHFSRGKPRGWQELCVHGQTIQEHTVKIGLSQQLVYAGWALEMTNALLLQQQKTACVHDPVQMASCPGRLLNLRAMFGRYPTLVFTTQAHMQGAISMLCNGAALASKLAC